MKEPLEKEIQPRIREVVASLPDVRVFEHNVFPCWDCGKRPSKDTGLGEHAADLLVIVGPYGRACFIEVKRPSNRNAKRDAPQREWAKFVRRVGGVAGVATNEAEAIALVAEARGLP